MSGNERTIFGNGDGSSDGRVLTDTDLNAISNNCTRRAWEVPGFSDILALDQMQEIVNGSDDYDSIFSPASPYTPFGRIAGVFTSGGGLSPRASGPRGVALGSGMLGAWTQPGGAQTPPAQNGEGSMLWAWIAGGGGTSHAATTAGYKRWDLVTCGVSEVSAAPVTRNFKDATTGARSSQSVVASKIVTISSLQIQAGEERNDGFETAGFTPAGQHWLYAVRVSGTFIDLIIDMTIPIGLLRKSLVLATHGMYFTGEWVPATGQLTTQGSATGRTVWILPPPGVAGNGDTRILGCRLQHALAAGSTVKVAAVNVGGVGNADRETITITADGTSRSEVIDFRRFQGGGVYGPYWGGGSYCKGILPLSTSIALKITAADSATSIVHSVEWYTVG